MQMDNRKRKSRYPAPFSIRFTDEERKSIEKAAAGQPLSSFIKDILREALPSLIKKRTAGKPLHIDQKSLAQLLGALGQSRISSNINQLAKAANSGSLPVNQEVLSALKEAVSNVHWMRETLIKALGLKPLKEGRHHDPER